MARPTPKEIAQRSLSKQREILWDKRNLLNVRVEALNEEIAALDKALAALEGEPAEDVLDDAAEV